MVDKNNPREECPITFSMLKEFREVFGDKVTVKGTNENEKYTRKYELEKISKNIYKELR